MWFWVVIVGLFWLWFVRRFVMPHWFKPRIVKLDPEDPLMQRAQRRARSELDRLQTFFRSRPEHTFVKAPFKFQRWPNFREPESELLWGRLECWEDRRLKATLQEQTRCSQGHPITQTQDFSLDEIFDWQVEQPDGSISGGYTMQAMLHQAQDRLNEQGLYGESIRAVNEQLSRYIDKLNETRGE